MSQDKRSLILQKARELIAEKNYHATSIKDIARAAGIAQGTPYLYFKNKEELARQLAIEIVSENDKLINKAVSSTCSLQEKLESIVKSILGHVYKNRAFATLIFRDINFMGKSDDKKSEIIINKKKETEKTVRKIFLEHRSDKNLNNNFTIDERLDLFFILIEGTVKRIVLGTFKNVKAAEKFVIKTLAASLFNQV